MLQKSVQRAWKENWTGWVGGMKKLKVRRALQVTAAQQLWYHRPAELGSH